MCFYHVTKVGQKVDVRKVFSLATLFFVCICMFGSLVWAKDSTTLVLANYRDIRDVNPHMYSGEIFAQNLLFEGLIHIDQQGRPQPWLAESWTISSDGKKYTFKLRQNVTFSDGTPFDAPAVVQNFYAILDNAKRHGWLESVRLLHETEKMGRKAIVSLDAYTVQVEFSEAYYPFLVELGVTRPFRMLSPACFKEGSTKNGTLCSHGTGSYLLKDTVLDQESIFVRNENYWGVQPPIETIVAKVIPDNHARLFALETGDIDLIYGFQLISAKSYKFFSQKEGFSGALSKPMSSRMLLLNSTSPILYDVRVRKALHHLTNREIISEKIMLGLESPAYTLFARSIPYADIDLEHFFHDEQKAAKLLDAAGWKMDGKVRKKQGQKFEITLTYDSDKVIERVIAQYLQSMWAKAGISMHVVGEEEQSHRDRLKVGNFDISFNSSWGIPYDPQSFLGGMRKPAVHGDYAAQQGLANKAQIDQTILAVLKSVDEQKRQELYTWILTTLHDSAVYLPLTYEQNRAIFSQKVKQVDFNPSQFEILLQRMRME